MDIVGLISNLVGAVKEFFGFQSKRLDLQNSAKVQQAAQAQQETDARDRTQKAIAGRDTKEVRNELSE